jgi:hypothetical protein
VDPHLCRTSIEAGFGALAADPDGQGFIVTASHDVAVMDTISAPND